MVCIWVRIPYPIFKETKRAKESQVLYHNTESPVVSTTHPNI